MNQFYEPILIAMNNGLSVRKVRLGRSANTPCAITINQVLKSKWEIV